MRFVGERERGGDRSREHIVIGENRDGYNQWGKERERERKYRS
jgi:hypothetical protein